MASPPPRSSPPPATLKPPDRGVNAYGDAVERGANIGAAGGRHRRLGESRAGGGRGADARIGGAGTPRPNLPSPRGSRRLRPMGSSAALKAEAARVSSPDFHPNVQRPGGCGSLANHGPRMVERRSQVNILSWAWPGSPVPRRRWGRCLSSIRVNVSPSQDRGNPPGKPGFFEYDGPWFASEPQPPAASEWRIEMVA